MTFDPLLEFDDPGESSQRVPDDHGTGAIPQKVKPDPPSEAILELNGAAEPRRLPFARKDGKPKTPKPTKAELSQRIRNAIELFRKGTAVHLVKAWLMTTYKYTGMRAKRLVDIARNRLAEEISGGQKVHLVSDAYQFYKSVRDCTVEVPMVAHPDTGQPIPARAPDIKDRLTAQGSIDRLLGLSAPTKIASTDPTGTYNPDELIALRQAALANPEVTDALAALAEALGGLNPGTGAILDKESTDENGKANGHHNGHIV